MQNFVLTTLAALATAAFAIPAAAQTPATPDCRVDAARARIDRTLASLKVDSKKETATTSGNGAVYRAIDYNFSGEIEGCVTLGGPVWAMKADSQWFTDAPDIAFPQEQMVAQSGSPRQPYKLPLSVGDGNVTPRYFAKGHFLGKDGAGFNLFIPKRADDWNGKLFVAQCGAGIYPPQQPLVPRGPSDPFPTGSGLNQFVENMIDRGYAVVSLRKDADRPTREVSKATLSNGRAIDVGFTAHAGLPLAMIEFAQKEVAASLGREPVKTYYYGHSGGGISGRLMNYTGANVARDGTPIVDGFILDDSGAGLYLPVAFRDGADVLFTGDEKRIFVPQIDITRQLYNPHSYLVSKRAGRDLLMNKGLGEKHRYYEIPGTSHWDVGAAQRNVRDKPFNPFDFLDVSGLIMAMMDNLDAWIAKEVAPPPSNSAGVVLPEVACPLGVYHAPNGATATTRLVPFDGKTMEPSTNSLTGTVDANGNGTVDKMETVTAAWKRLNLIRANEKFDRQKYVGCVQKATEKLVSEKFLPAGAQTWYLNRASLLLENVGAQIE